MKEVENGRIHAGPDRIKPAVPDRGQPRTPVFWQPSACKPGAFVAASYVGKRLAGRERRSAGSQLLPAGSKPIPGRVAGSQPGNAGRVGEYPENYLPKMPGLAFPSQAVVRLSASAGIPSGEVQVTARNSLDNLSETRAMELEPQPARRESTTESRRAASHPVPS